MRGRILVPSFQAIQYNNNRVENKKKPEEGWQMNVDRAGVSHAVVLWGHDAQMVIAAF
jgi:hypothetical protein